MNEFSCLLETDEGQTSVTVWEDSLEDVQAMFGDTLISVIDLGPDEE